MKQWTGAVQDGTTAETAGPNFLLVQQDELAVEALQHGHALRLAGVREPLRQRDHESTHHQREPAELCREEPCANEGEEQAIVPGAAVCG
jgi:hypothetical protein